MFIFFSLVLVALIGLWAYALRSDPDRMSDLDKERLHRRFLLVGGVLLPMISITAVLAIGIPAGHAMLPLPPMKAHVVRIDVTGHQWWWEVSYPGTSVRLIDELHMPAEVPVDIHVGTADVIHSFWVPRLGGKIDAIPGRRNVLRLRADEPGVYRGQCAEFCGLAHAHMTFLVHVHSQNEFEDWLEAADAND